LSGWLTTVVARVCLDMLRSRKARKEHSLDEELPGKVARLETGIDPEAEAVIADSVGLALLVVLEALTPAERVAYVLHDIFDLPSTKSGRSSDEARLPHANWQVVRDVACRARKCLNRRRSLDAGLIRLLGPDVVLIGDDYSARRGSPIEVVGSDAVAKVFVGRAQGAQLAMVDGAPAMVWAPGGKPKVVFNFEITGGRIDEIEVVSDPARLAGMKVEVVDA
jgi:RNA polymerase sigma-70 factor (ECF subfamily)